MNEGVGVAEIRRSGRQRDFFGDNKGTMGVRVDWERLCKSA